MIAVRFIVLLCFSVKTVIGIIRIPIRPTFRGNSDENYEEENAAETDDYNPQIVRELEETVPKTTENVAITSTTPKANGELKFTDFILEAAKVLKTYENNVLEQAFEIIDDEVWKDVYKGCKSHELADVRKYASDQLGLLKDAPADTLRQHLNYIINILTNGDYGDMRDLVVYVNTLYVGESNKFIEVLLALVHRRMSDGVDLAAILKDALNNLIFDHYCKLDDLVRHELIKMIKHYWRQFISQILNAKTGSNADILPYVTPFVYEKVNKNPSKQRRFNKVRAGQPLLKRWKDKNEYSAHKSNRRTKIKMRANTIEKSNENLKSAVWDGGDEATPKENILRNNKTAASIQNTRIKNSSTYEQRDRVRFTRLSSTDKANMFTPKVNQDLRYTNNTIIRLINIGKLANEINDMIGTEGRVRREGEPFMNWDPFIGMDYLGSMFGIHPSATQKIKTDDGNPKKDVIISMKANYRE